MDLSGYPVYPLLSTSQVLETTEQVQKGLEPKEHNNFNMETDDDVDYHNQMQPFRLVPCEDCFESYLDNTLFDPYGQPMEDEVASQDLWLRQFNDNEAPVKTILIICGDHCEISSMNPLSEEQTCKQSGCEEGTFGTDKEFCFQHVMEYATFNCKERYRASWEGLERLRRQQQEEKATEAAALVLNIGAEPKKIDDPEGYGAWYQYKAAEYDVQMASENYMRIMAFQSLIQY